MHAVRRQKTDKMARGQIVQGDLDYDGRTIIYIIKGQLSFSSEVNRHEYLLTSIEADQTSYINYMKPLILAEELQVDHIISVIDTTSECYYKVHPERYVPAIKDRCPQTNQDLTVFESTACLQYLADRYDTDGYWTGRNAGEKAAVFSWTAYQTAGLGYVLLSH